MVSFVSARPRGVKPGPGSMTGGRLTERRAGAVWCARTEARP
jgi:hypothetical protein